MESTTVEANAVITESISLKLQTSLQLLANFFTIAKTTVMKFKSKSNQGKKGLDILLNKNQREKKTLTLRG